MRCNSIENSINSGLIYRCKAQVLLRFVSSSRSPNARSLRGRSKEGELRRQGNRVTAIDPAIGMGLS